MGYLWLALALFAGVTKGYCGKRTSGYVNQFRDAVLANTIRMGFCVLFGFLLTVAQNGSASLRVDGTTLLISAISGVCSAAFVVSWLICVKKSAYMMMDVFLMMGAVIPLLGSSIQFGESIKLTQWLGLGILLAAVLLMCSYNNSIKERITPAALALLLLCGASSGLADFAQKLFVEYSPWVSAAVFNFYTYLWAGIVLVGYYLITGINGSAPTDITGLKKMMVFIPIMALCLFANSFFKTLAAEYLPAAQMYPLSQGAALILSSIMSAVLFKEKLTAKCIAGLILAFAALLIINLL